MTLKRLLAFAVAMAMIMGIVPAMAVTAANDDAAVVAAVANEEYNSLEDAIAAAVAEYENDGAMATVTLLGSTDEDFTLEYGIVKLVTDGFEYTGTATVTDAVLLSDCYLTNVEAELTGVSSDKSMFGYTSMDTGVEVVEGAQVRIGDGADEDGMVTDSDSGLRFIATTKMIDTLATMAYELYNTESGEYAEGYEMGIRLMAESSSSEVFVPATLWQQKGKVFTAALTNLKESNYNRRYTANAYVVIEGVRFDDKATSTRSIYQVSAGLLAQDAEQSAMSQDLVDVLNAYVNQTGVRLVLSDFTTEATLTAATGNVNGAYSGEAVFKVGSTSYKNGVYTVVLEAIGRSVINTKLFNQYVRINNNNSKVAPLTTITDNGNGTYTITFDYADMNKTAGVITEPVTLENGEIVAYIPAGVTFNGSATRLKLLLTAIDDEQSEVEAEEGEDLNAFDIHVSGIDENNTTPIIITLPEVAEKGLNRGNLKLYHVEDGKQVAMEQVDSVEMLTKHNQFTYEPLDGTITVALASFSEVALVSDNTKAWEGSYDYSWYKNPVDGVYTIANADQLAAFSAIVGGMAKDEENNPIVEGDTNEYGLVCDSFAGKTVKLVSDINLNGSADENDENYLFYPIGYYNSTGSYTRTNDTDVVSSFNSFEGTFDGNGHTIKNFYQNTWEMFGDYNSGYTAGSNYYDDGMGLFGYVYKGKVMNLTVDNFSSDGEFTPTGVIAAYADGDSDFTNIAITNCNPRVYNTGNGGIIGIAGDTSTEDDDHITLKNITVDNSNKISALWGSWDVACGGLVGMYRGNVDANGNATGDTISFENCHVSAQIDVNNDVCGNYQYYAYRYAGMIIGSVRHNTTNGDGRTIPDMAGISASGCTVNYGDWNNYWYCELVANSIASYTHDHQFSRLEQVEAVDGTKITYLDGTTGTVPGSGRYNYVVVSEPYGSDKATCYHFVDGKVWNHEDAGEETVNGEKVLKEDKQHVYLPFHQLFTGYSWGVSSIGLEKYSGVVTNLGITEDDQKESVEKFEKADTVKTAYTTGTTVTVGELFKALENPVVKIKEENIMVSVSAVGEDSTVTGTYTANAEAWTKGELTFNGVGEAIVAIQDYYFCTPTTIEVMVEDYLDVDKFIEKKDVTTFNKNVVTLGELFEEKSGVTVTDANVAVTVENVSGDVSGRWTKADVWENGTITVTGEGELKVTITDKDYCNDTTTTVSFAKAMKFARVFPNTEDYLYRVGNDATTPVALSSLFVETGIYEMIGNTTVTIEPVDGTVASGTYNETNKKITFSGTGVVKVTIQDDYCIPTELYLEVVDAVNATSATNATANNVVLLNDIGSGFTVSGRYTVYGNGFTLNYTGNGQYLNNGLKQGIVTVSENGTLDNLRIKASVYPNAYLYYGSTPLGDFVQGGPSSVEGDKTRYHYQLSAVAASGNATISNCYIYGGRNNVFVNTGDVTIKDSVLECGVVANVQIQSNASHTITFENLTTIQYQVNPTIGDTSKVMLGAGVLVGPETNDNPEIVLNGDLKQYNWVTAEDANAVSDTKVTKAIIQGAVDATEYNHTVNGKTASNLGIIYMNELAAEVENKTGLPYELGTVSMTMASNTVKGNAYSLQNATADQIYSDYENADRATVNGLYAPQFKYSADLGGQYIEKTDDGDEHCYREGDTIYVMFPSGDTKELDLAAMVDITKYTGQDLGLVVTCKDSNGNAVTVTDGKVSLSAMDEYTVTYTVTDTLFFDKEGNESVGTKTYPWDVTVSVSLKDTAVPDARFEFNTESQKMGYYKPLIGDVKQYLPFLAGLKIYDYNGKMEYLRFDGDADFNKVASVTITGYDGNYALVEVKLTDGGVINTRFLARANSGGAGTYTGKITTKNNVIYFVNDGGTSNKDTTTTAAYWYVDYYKFTGNNGVAIQSAQQTFNSSGSSVSTPSDSFNTTIKYTVTYDANEGNCGQTVGYATSASAAVTLPTPTRSGYLFTGWYTAASGGTRVGGAGETYTPSANITLYAQWGKPSTVTYDANGGSVTPESEKYTGTALTLPTPTRDGRAFTGWYDAAEGGTRIGGAGDLYNPNADITLYAQWSKPVTVTYNANGGTCDTAEVQNHPAGTALTLPTPTITGYKFLGWYDAVSGGTKIGDAGESYTPEADITLYAQWEQIAYTITVTTSSATVDGVTNQQTAYYGDEISVTVSFNQNNNKTLTVKDDSGNTVLSKNEAGTYTFTMPASNVTIKASSSGGCVTPDTLITLADGSQKRIDSLTGDEMLKVWDFETGEYTEAPIAVLRNHGLDNNTVITMEFDNGIVTKAVNEHGYYDVAARKFVAINGENAESYVGHSFVVETEGGYTTAVLEKVTVEEKEVEAWSILTAYNYNFITDGVFSLSSSVGGLEYFMPYENDENLKIDAAKKQADIEKYGLFTYDELAQWLTEEQFEALTAAQIKVSIGKGYITMEEFIHVIEVEVLAPSRPE